VESFAPLLSTDVFFVLEGLEFRTDRPRSFEAGKGRVGITTRGASLHVANCRFLMPVRACIYTGSGTRRCVVRNSELLSPAPGTGLDGLEPSGGQRVMENCLVIAGPALTCYYPDAKLRDASIQLTH